LELEEDWAFVYYDIFLDILFFIDILIRFNTPIYLEGRLITDRKIIVVAYLKSWFFLDLLACLPMSFLRKNSADWQRGGSDIKNFIQLNWNALPRFYPMLMLPKLLVRIRSIEVNMRKVLKRASVIPIQV